eukprot:841325_1
METLNRMVMILKVRWEGMVFDDAHLDVLMLLNRMVMILKNNCADWMLIGYHWKFAAKTTDILDEFKLKHNCNVVYNTTETYCDFVISHRECRINGMPCECCKQHPLFDS